jgi:4-hydroxy-tetrahydrodipicolinate synthase
VDSQSGVGRGVAVAATDHAASRQYTECVASLGTILTAAVTPFDDDRSVDEEGFVAVLHHLHAHGSDGVVACGTTGEAATLTDEEHMRVVELAVNERPDGMTVVAGAGSNDTRHAVRLTERATELGADAILSVTPYYNRPNRRGIVRHFEEVAKATHKPIVLYNIPQRTGVNMPPDLLAELAQIDGISAVKQANNAELAPIDGLDVYAGNDEILGRVLDMGGAGGILTSSHIVGDRMRRMVDEPSERDEIVQSLSDVFATMAILPAAIANKAALNLLGLPGGTVRLPYVEPTEDELEALRGMLERNGLLTATHRGAIGR